MSLDQGCEDDEEEEEEDDDEEGGRGGGEGESVSRSRATRHNRRTRRDRSALLSQLH
jgi:hypothetical protein